MPASPVTFRLEDIAIGRRVMEAIARQFDHDRSIGEERRTTYYDTFDWRIYHDGGVLKAQYRGRANVLSWTTHGGQERARTTIADRPRFVSDLPAGGLRQGLEGVVAMRRLLKLFTVESRGDTLNLRDERRKIVARLQVERSRVHPERGEKPSAELPPMLRARPVRGYDKEFTAVREILARHDLPLLDETEFAMGAAIAGLHPGDYSRRLDLQLQPDQRSEDALRAILSRLLQVMTQNQEGLRANLDSEFLHDFRVAVRRTRSALTQVKGVLPPGEVTHFKTEFSWLGQITGPTRDLDVYQLKMPGYRASLPEHLRPDLDPLSEFLDRHQQLEHRELVQLLDTRRYKTLLTDWERFLSQPFGDQTDRPAAATPIGELASERIWNSYRKVIRKGSDIGPETPARALHRLRIDCKKLRYLLEFFRSLFAEESMTALIDRLKRLQDNLGDFNDLEVQQHTLKQFAQGMQVEKIATATSLMAMGRLVERLEQRQIEEREAFHKHFKKFSSRKNRQAFQRLFKTAEHSSA